MPYLFDTNIFITLKNEMPNSYWPTFWERFVALLNTGDIYTSTKVLDELKNGNDDLALWLKSNVPSTFFLPVDAEVMSKYQDTQNWAKTNPTYSPAARQTFAEVADAYLIATAAAKALTLVTNERPAPNSKKSIKIPDVCNGLGVRYCDFNTVLRELNFTI